MKAHPHALVLFHKKSRKHVYICARVHSEDPKRMPRKPRLFGLVLIRRFLHGDPEERLPATMVLCEIRWIVCCDSCSVGITSTASNFLPYSSTCKFIDLVTVGDLLSVYLCTWVCDCY